MASNRKGLDIVWVWNGPKGSVLRMEILDTVESLEGRMLDDWRYTIEGCNGSQPICSPLLHGCHEIISFLCHVLPPRHTHCFAMTPKYQANLTEVSRTISSVFCLHNLIFWYFCHNDRKVKNVGMFNKCKLVYYSREKLWSKPWGAPFRMSHQSVCSSKHRSH
jgi:hypothetical protein